jgi:hypothetical protein
MNELVVKGLSEADFEKVSTFKLPRSTDGWNQEIIKILYEDYPWLISEAVQPWIDYQDMDANSGIALGTVLLTYEPMADPKEMRARAKANLQQAAPMQIRLPIIINNFELYPFDVFIAEDGRMHPLTPTRIGEMLKPTDNFVGLSYEPRFQEGSGGIQSVPGDAAYGRLGSQRIGEMEVTASYRPNPGSRYDDSIMSQILPLVRDCHCEEFRSHVKSNPPSLVSWSKPEKVKYLQTLMTCDGLTPDDYENAMQRVIPKNVAYFKREAPGQWKVTCFSDYLYDPQVERYSETELLDKFGGNQEIADQIWESNDFILTMGHQTVEPLIMSSDSLPVVDDCGCSGQYIVATKGMEILSGAVIDTVCDYLGNDLGLKVFIGDSGSWGVAGNIVGELTGDITSWESKESAPCPGEWTCFVYPKDMGGYKASLPFKIRNQYSDRGKVCLTGHDMYMRDAVFIMTPGLKTMVCATNVTSPVLGEHLGANVYYVPASWCLCSLGRKVNLVETKAEFHRDFRNQTVYQIHRNAEAAGSSRTVNIRKAGNIQNSRTTDTGRFQPAYRMEGPILEPILGTAQSNYWGMTAGEWPHKIAKLALVLLGCSLEAAEDILDRVTETDPVVVSNLRPVAARAKVLNMPKMSVGAQGQEVLMKVGYATDEIELDIDTVCDKIRRPMFKEAAILKDDESIDSILSLNFITPENLAVYVQNIPRFEDIESRLAELLLLTRMGLKEVPESGAYRALSGLAEVTDSLKSLRYFLQGSMDPHQPEMTEMTPQDEQGYVEGEEEGASEMAEQA